MALSIQLATGAQANDRLGRVNRPISLLAGTALFDGRSREASLTQTSARSAAHAGGCIVLWNDAFFGYSSCAVCFLTLSHE